MKVIINRETFEKLSEASFHATAFENVGIINWQIAAVSETRFPLVNVASDERLRH